MRRARWKRKNVRRVGLRQRRPPAAGGRRLAVPRGGQRRKRAALGETFGPGRYRDTSCVSPRCRSRFREEQPAAAKRVAEAIRQPPRRRRHHPPRDGSMDLAEENSVPEGQQSSAASIRRPPFARGGPLHRSAPSAFFSSTGRGAFSFLGKTKKRMGGAPPAGAEAFVLSQLRFIEVIKPHPLLCHFAAGTVVIFIDHHGQFLFRILRRRQRLPCAGIRCPGP